MDKLRDGKWSEKVTGKLKKFIQCCTSLGIQTEIPWAVERAKMTSLQNRCKLHNQSFFQFNQSFNIQTKISFFMANLNRLSSIYISYLILTGNTVKIVQMP